MLQPGLLNVQKTRRRTSRLYLWMMNIGPPRRYQKEHLCIHEHGLPHGLCPYPCPYANSQMPSYMDSLDLSDISDLEDYMVTSSDKDIPAFEDTPY